VTGHDEFFDQLDQLADLLDTLRPGGADPEEDPHAGCYQPHLGPDGYQDCDGRPL
jgi:hypothetical protein